MADEPSLSPVFPQYQPPANPAQVHFMPDQKQQKPLMKMIAKKMFAPKRIAKLQKGVASKKKKGQR